MSFLAQVVREPADVSLCGRERFGCCRRGIEPVVERLELGAGLCPAREQLVVGLRSEPAFGLDDSLQVRFHLFEPAGCCFQRRKEGPQLAGGLAQAKLGVTQLVGGP